MSKWTFFGRVLPERATFTFESPLRGRAHDPYLDIEYNFSVVIHSNQVIADIEPTKGNPNAYDLQHAAAGCIKIVTDLAGYHCGYYYNVEIVSAICSETGEWRVFGIEIPILAARRGVRPAAIEGKLLHAVSRSPAAQMVLADFRESMQAPSTTGFYCYRAIEAMMQSMKADPADENDNSAWIELRQKLCLDRSALDEVKRHADFPRHGRLSGMTSDERDKVFALTDEMIKRYLTYLSRGQVPLTEEEFPTLRFP